MGGERWGLLYDEQVCDYPLIEHAVWGMLPAMVQIVVQDEGLFDRMQLILEQMAQRIQRSHSLSLVGALPIESLDGMIVIRSHPEMFGQEIMAAQRGSVGSVTIVTVEEYRDGERWCGYLPGQSSGAA